MFLIENYFSIFIFMLKFAPYFYKRLGFEKRSQC
ncbi:hypothetical protein CUP0331 [Campylobacter upsaliensis RM3195]|nr:hypothetical protein CUP0331 [Campylobacter upsaliensis RM3195]